VVAGSSPVPGSSLRLLDCGRRKLPAIGLGKVGFRVRLHGFGRQARCRGSSVVEHVNPQFILYPSISFCSPTLRWAEEIGLSVIGSTPICSTGWGSSSVVEQYRFVPCPSMA